MCAPNSACTEPFLFKQKPRCPSQRHLDSRHKTSGEGDCSTTHTHGVYRLWGEVGGCVRQRHERLQPKVIPRRASAAVNTATASAALVSSSRCWCIPTRRSLEADVCAHGVGMRLTTRLKLGLHCVSVLACVAGVRGQTDIPTVQPTGVFALHHTLLRRARFDHMQSC